ncbi:MAG TPA: phosphodiester glycosidase family protein [Capsulimonadaceae bacterium]|nr:phosphodiester glycosidase family protein [Capsulimonadaceae bacterium]
MPSATFFATLHAPAFGVHPARRSTAVATPSTAALIPAPSVDTADLPNPGVPIKIQRAEVDKVSLVLIEGGIVGTRRTPMRAGVRDIVDQCGASAGLNGTFFANASLRGTDNKLIGPSLCGDEQQATLSPFDKRPQLTGRPVVLMAPNRTRIVPYDPTTLDSDAGLRAALPGMTDAFLGGVWLVHNGVAASDEKMASFSVKDDNDYRRRAFFALMPDGRPVLGATDCSTSSRDLAAALQEAGVREAVLLDSGFSTSLVYKDQILVSGHSTKSIPSRPIPHALVLFDHTSQLASRRTPSARVAG